MASSIDEEVVNETLEAIVNTNKYAKAADHVSSNVVAVAIESGANTPQAVWDSIWHDVTNPSTLENINHFFRGKDYDGKVLAPNPPKNHKVVDGSKAVLYFEVQPENVED